ncbi:hypothetical protein G9A89_005169 [Geosiphon pyriformis]|nr:hypothetical protein G9A89_005169 [Geosiphon pyriformis]
MLSASTLAKKSSRKPTTTLEVAAKYTINNNLRELNQLLQSQDEKENKEKSSPKMDKIQKTFETLLRALETLAKLETRNKTYNLDIEKAYYNVITKMIDFGLQENALKTARLLHSRLLKCFGKCSIATNLRHQSTTSINETNISKLKYSSDLITFFGDLCVLPLEIETKNHEEILLVIAYQLCVLRALIEYKDGQLIKLIPACFEMTGNVFDWCQKLGKLRKDIAAKQYGILIRMLSRASSQLQSLSGNNCIEILRLRAFSLRAFVETEQFKLPLFFEQCLKVGTQFEKNLKINPKISFKALLCFYQDMNRIIQPYVDQSPKCHSNLLKSATIKLSIGHLAIESLISEEEDIKYFAYIRDAKESFSTLEAAFVNESLSQEEFIDLSNLLKKGELLRKSCKTVCEMMNIGKKQDSMNLGISNKKKNTKNLALLQTPQDKERLYKAIGALVWSGASFFGIICEKLFSQYKAQHQINPCLFPPDRLFLVTLDMFDLFLRTTFNISDPHSYAICTSFIERALVIARTNCLEEPLRWISNSYYYIGGILYRENQNQDAVEPIRKSCNFLYNYLYYAKPEGKMLQEEEIKLQLGKRFEVLGACHTALGEIENARNAFEQSLRSFPISEYDKFSSLMKEESVLVASQHLPIIPRLIDRHVKSSYIDSPDAVFTPTHEIMMITRGEGIKVAGLVEYQIRVLKSHGNKVDTYKVQMTLCEKLLEWYSVEDFPLRRARSSKNQKDREHTLVLLATAKELLKTEARSLRSLSFILSEIGEDSGLYKLKQFYLATAYSWSSIVSQECRQRFPEGFKIALTLWKGILIDIHPFGDGSIVTENHLEEAKKK